jgi:hypothetical protein
MSHDDFKYLEQIAKEIKATPDFKETLEKQLREAHTSNSNPKWRNRRLAYAVAGIGFIFLVFLSPLSTVAQQVLETFFRQLSTDTTPLSLTEISPSSLVWIEVSNIETVESELNITLKKLNPPSAYILQSVTYTSSPLQVIAEYSTAGRNLIFTQSEIGWTTDDSVGSSAIINQVDVLGTTGEYVEGFWVDEEDRNQWSNNTPFRRLRWQMDEMQYEIFAMGGSADTDNLDLVTLAETLR